MVKVVGAFVGVVGAVVVGCAVGIGVGALVKHVPCVDVWQRQVAGLCCGADDNQSLTSTMLLHNA